MTIADPIDNSAKTGSYLTGRYRLRSLKRWFRDPVVIIEVEEVHRYCDEVWFDVEPPYYTYRAATPDDITDLLRNGIRIL